MAIAFQRCKRSLCYCGICGSGCHFPRQSSLSRFSGPHPPPLSLSALARLTSQPGDPLEGFWLYRRFPGDSLYRDRTYVTAAAAVPQDFAEVADNTQVRPSIHPSIRERVSVVVGNAFHILRQQPPPLVFPLSTLVTLLVCYAALPPPQFGFRMRGLQPLTRYVVFVTADTQVAGEGLRSLSTSDDTVTVLVPTPPRSVSAKPSTASAVGPFAG